MDYHLEERAYTSPLLRYIYRNSSKGKSDFIPYHMKLSSLPIKNTNDNKYMSNINSLQVTNLLPISLFSNYNSNNMSATDILFLPKFSTFLFFTIPIFAMLPNLTLYTKHWFFFAPK